MTDELADARALRTQAREAKGRAWTLLSILFVSLLGLSSSMTLGSTLAMWLSAPFVIVSGAGVFLMKSRHGTARADLEDICTKEAEYDISDGRAAIRRGSIDEAQSALERAAQFGEVGLSVTDSGTEKVESRAKAKGVKEGLPVAYAVSNTYLTLIERYRGSQYDTSAIDRQFKDIDDTIESGSHGEAIKQLIDATESLTLQSTGVEISNQPTGYDAISELTNEQKRVLRKAGYDDLIRTAVSSVNTIAAILGVEQEEAESIRSACQSLTADPASINQLIEGPSTLDGYRERWNELAGRVQDGILSETAHTLETGVAEIPDLHHIDPDSIAKLREPLQDSRMRAIQTVTPIASLRKSVSSQPWVTVEFPIVEPAPTLQATRRAKDSELTDSVLAIATAATETIRDDLGVSRDTATEARAEALDQLGGRRVEHEQLRSAVLQFTAYPQIFDYIDEWTTFHETVQDAEASLERGQNGQSNPTETSEALSQAQYQVGHLESIVDTTAFPDPVHVVLKEQYDELADRLTDIEATVREQHREFLAETEPLLEQADHEAESGNLESAKTSLREARDTYSKVGSLIDPDELADIEAKIRRVDNKVTVPLFKKRIAALEADVQTIEEDMGTDIESARSQLSTVGSSLDDLQEEIGREVRSQEQTQKLLQSINKIRAFATDVEQQLARQEAEQARTDAFEAINRAETLLQDGQVDQADSILEAASSTLDGNAQALAESELTEVRTAIAQVEDQIAAIQFQETVEDLESSIQTVRESTADDIASREERLDSIEASIEGLREDIQEEISRETTRDDLQQRVGVLEESIADLRQQLTVERHTQLLEEANDRLEDARASIEESELRDASEKIAAAQTTVRNVDVDELETEVDAFHENITTVRTDLQEARTRHALDETKHELQRAKGYLQHDVEDTRDRLRDARVHLKATEFLIDCLDISEDARNDLLERSGRHRSEIQTLTDRCREREIAESIEAAKQTIERAQAAFQEETITAARERSEEATSWLEAIPGEVDSSRIVGIQEDLETLQTAIAQHEIGEYIANAESTVDQAEAERAAGEVSEAIDAYQRAISTYEAAKLEAQAGSIPEAYEIGIRIEQLPTEIEAVKEQWAETRTQQIDRELRAGERAIAQGLDAVREGDLDIAEIKYDTADEAADAAQALLADTPEDPTGGELTLPASLVSEYQSAYSSLVGHLGYLRTQIQEAKDSETGGDSRATPLAEYYDGLYTVYRALPNNANPVWQEALTTVLFGGDGLADGASGYGTQQANRNETQISTLREENGDGDRITNFVCIETAAPRPEDQELVPAQQPLPVAPDSETVLPVTVDSELVADAIDLLAEFPVAPDADYGDPDSAPVIDVSYFEDRLAAEADRPAETSVEESAETDEKSPQLEQLMEDIEADINDLEDAA